MRIVESVEESTEDIHEFPEQWEEDKRAQWNQLPTKTFDVNEEVKKRSASWKSSEKKKRSMSKTSSEENVVDVVEESTKTSTSK